jgi:hypothetical protein
MLKPEFNGRSAMKIKSVFLAAVLMGVLCLSGTVFAILSGGGTSGNPYLIQSRADFDEFANSANAATYWTSGKYTRLMYDPNLAGTTYTKSPISPDTSNSTKGVFQGTKFAGNFDGNGHTISNLTINSSTLDFIGLIGYLDAAGQVKNLGMVNVNLTGRYAVGGLVGYDKGTITNCYATGSVSGANYVGGLVGWNDSGVVSDSYAAGTASGTSDSIGGLVGRNVGTLSNCYANETVTGSTYSVGGLVGYNGNDSAHSGTIINCHASGNVTASFDAVGGLVGTNTYSSVISNSYATGTVNGASKVGGLVGYNDSTVAISDCYATGQVTGSGTDYYSVGGLVGENSSGTLLRCYATGATYGIRWVGGLVGWNRFGSILNCYATGTASGTSLYVGGLVGYNTSEYGWPSCIISNCYATGAASGSGGIGGLIGFNGYPSVTSYCYSTGTATPVGTGAAGGMVGTNQYGTYTACFWNTQTNGRGNSVGLNFGGAITGMLGKNTADMQQQATFTVSPYLWDFFGETTNGTNDYWRMCVDGADYPRLTWHYILDGDFVCPNGVAVEDLDYYAGRWLMNNCTSGNTYCGGADMNKSGTVNLADFAVLAAHWLEGV